MYSVFSKVIGLEIWQARSYLTKLPIQAVTTCLLAAGVSQRNTPEYEIINKHDSQ